jgi:hypothetical protein
LFTLTNKSFLASHFAREKLFLPAFGGFAQTKRSLTKNGELNLSASWRIRDSDNAIFLLLLVFTRNFKPYFTGWLQKRFVLTL